MDIKRKYLNLKCEVCSDYYLQQERVYKKSQWKNRCRSHRKKFYKCIDCGIEIHRTHQRCKPCNGKKMRIPYEKRVNAKNNNCLDCNCKIYTKSKRCSDCQNKNQKIYKNREYANFLQRNEWKFLREEIKNRDNYSCKSCKSKENLLVHHVFRYRDYPELRTTKENLLTMCRTCHRKVHTYKDERYYETLPGQVCNDTLQRLRSKIT